MSKITEYTYPNYRKYELYEESLCEKCKHNIQYPRYRKCGNMLCKEFGEANVHTLSCFNFTKGKKK